MFGCHAELAKGQFSCAHPWAVIYALCLIETTGGVKTEDRITTSCRSPAHAG